MPQFSLPELETETYASKGGKLSRAETKALTNQIDAAEKMLNESKASQGLVGKIYDGMKANLGGSARATNWPEKLWAAVLDEDLSSSRIRENLRDARSAIASGEIEAVKHLRVNGPDGKSTFAAVNAAKSYDKSQEQGVNFIADTAVLSAAIAGRGKGLNQYLNIAARGAVIKTAIKAIDGSYSHPGDDLASGAILALSVPFANKLGHGSSLANVFSGRSLRTVSHAIEGAVIGHTQQTVSVYENARGQGFEPGKAVIDALSSSSKNPYGLLIGAATGGLGGYFTFGRKAHSPSCATQLETRLTSPEVSGLASTSEKSVSAFVTMETDDLFYKPLNQLKEVLDHNMLNLTSRLEGAGVTPQLAFHGAPQSRAAIVENFFGKGVSHDLPLYLASPLKTANTATEKLADIVSSFKHASGYAGTPAHGKLFVFDAGAADMSGMYIKGKPAALPAPFQPSVNAAEKVSSLSNDLKLLKVFEAEELRYVQPPQTIPDYFERLSYLEPLELQRLADAVLKAAGI
jgi:hypothetical protein